MSFSKSAALFTLLISFTQAGFAGSRPDSHAPIGVMGDHIHEKGEWMFSYRYMNMNMDGNRIGTDSVSVDEILRPTGEFGVTPLEMDMQMHMLGTMYAPSDKLTLMVMLPFVDLSMDHRTAMGAEFATESSGIGDVKVSSIYQLSESNNANWLLNFGISLPTGSIDEEDFLPPIGSQGQLPFPMQIGSGTYDLLPGITYTSLKDKYSYGSQVSAVLRLGDNDNGYTLGDRAKLNTWFAKPFTEHLSGSIRLEYQWWDDIDGVDQEASIPLSNAMGRTISTVDPSLRGGQRLELALGANAMIGEQEHRLSLELAYPLQQNLHGPQLETDLTFTLGYQKAF